MRSLPFFLTPAGAEKRFPKLLASVIAKKDVEKRVEEGVEAGEPVADSIVKVEGLFNCTLVFLTFCEKQGNKSVTAHQVIRTKNYNKYNSNDDQGRNNSPAFMIRDRRRVQ